MPNPPAPEEPETSLPFQAPRQRDQSSQGGQGGQPQLWCPIRKLWLQAAPEEYVRLSLLHWLMEGKQVPKGRIAVERGLVVAGRKRRFDVMVVNAQAQPLLLAECKAPAEPLNTATLEQIATYQQALPATWWVVTNGTRLQVYQKGEQRFETVRFLPVYAAW